MQQNTKKNIAKEILIVTTILVITLLCWLVIYPYNTFKKRQISTAEKQIEIQNVEMDSLRLKLPSEKRKNLYNGLKEEHRTGCSQEVFINRYASKTELIGLHNYLRDYFIQDRYPNQEAFILMYADDLSENSVSSKFKKIENNKECLSKKIEENQLEIFTPDEHKNLFFNVLSILLCLAYPLRFLFLAVKWSLKILKE